MEYSYFAGGNSGAGFYDCFSQLIPEGEKKEHVIILKGGPGVGKSTLMKKIAAAARKKKEDMELFFCSGDPDSLDAVRLVERGFLILDGTAPHSKDPVWPGAVDVIMNLGEQIDREKIRPYREEIIRLGKENKEHYRRAYAVLGAAAALAEERYREVEECIDRNKLMQLQQELFSENGNGAEERGNARRLFLDAITWKGRVSYAPYAVQAQKSLGLRGAYADVVLDILCRKENGCHTERFLQPLLPERTAHLHIPEKKLFLTGGQFETDEVLEAENYMKQAPSPEIIRYQKEEERLIGLAVKSLKTCKKLHDELESIYKMCVDFERITEKTEQLLNELGLFC